MAKLVCAVFAAALLVLLLVVKDIRKLTIAVLIASMPTIIELSAIALPSNKQGIDKAKCSQALRDGKSEGGQCMNELKALKV
jgi:hypothetical protein